MVFIHGKPLGLAFVFPLHFGFIKLLQEFLFLVAKLCSFLILLRFDYTVFLRLDIFYFRLQAQDILRNINVQDVHSRSRFIQDVNGLVRKKAIGNVAIRKLDTSLNGSIGIDDIVVVFVFVFDVIQDLDGLFWGGGIHHHYLETTRQSAILLNVLSVFVQGRSTDALDFSSRQGRLKHIRGIQRARSPSSTYDGV